MEEVYARDVNKEKACSFYPSDIWEESENRKRGKKPNIYI